MGSRFLIALWLPVIWALYKLNLLEIFVIAVVFLGLYEIVSRIPWRGITILASLQMAGFLLIGGFSAKEIWFLILVVVANDVAAYFLGKACRSPWMRQHPFPGISPKKTVGGYLGGTIVGVGMGMVVANKLGINHWYGFLPLIVCVIAIAGDLLESKFKRVYQIKDSGDDLFTKKFLCGHGGVYDRFDAISLVCLAWGIAKFF